MKAKLTPQRKKNLSYKKDRRTRTCGSGPHMDRLWAKRKARLNRNQRRKAAQLLEAAARPDNLDILKRGDDDTTSGLIKNGVIRETNKKLGVRKLGDVVQENLKLKAELSERSRKIANAKRKGASKTIIAKLKAPIPGEPRF